MSSWVVEQHAVVSWARRHHHLPSKCLPADAGRKNHGEESRSGRVPVGRMGLLLVHHGVTSALSTPVNSPTFSGFRGTTGHCRKTPKAACLKNLRLGRTEGEDRPGTSSIACKSLVLSFFFPSSSLCIHLRPTGAIPLHLCSPPSPISHAVTCSATLPCAQSTRPPEHVECRRAPRPLDLHTMLPPRH